MAFLTSNKDSDKSILPGVPFAMLDHAGILSGAAIEAGVSCGAIEISPFRKEAVNPASYDLRLGTTVKVFKHAVEAFDVGTRVPDGSLLKARGEVILDTAKNQKC